MLNSPLTHQEAHELREVRMARFQEQAARKRFGNDPMVLFVEAARRDAQKEATDNWLWLGATVSERSKVRYRENITRMEQVAEALAEYRDELRAAA